MPQNALRPVPRVSILKAIAAGLLAAAMTAIPVPPAKQALAQSGQQGDYVPPPPPSDEPPPPPDYNPPGQDYEPPAPEEGVGDNTISDPPPPPDYADQDGQTPDYGQAPPPPTQDDAGAPPVPQASSLALQAGEAYHTRFSGTVQVQGPTGPVRVIDLNGVVGSIIDLRNPGEEPNGQHWIDEPQRSPALAADSGQVFGITIDNDNQPNIYITATSAYGLHLRPGTTDWMDGMWGPDGGPGTVYKLSAETGYTPQVFADITLEGRANTGAALGNIAFDRWNRQFFVTDLETGMIHRISGDGEDLGFYDHGLDGRSSYLDAWTGATLSLPQVIFDPETGADPQTCSAGAFENHPECWNYADFRRRVFGVAVRSDEKTEEVRVYYAIWGSDGFGNPAWDNAGNDRRNSIWSIGLDDDGNFDLATVRREFELPPFFPNDPARGHMSGNSHAVSDIEFADCGPQTIMLVAERGAQRNLGLDKEDAFARPHESRVLRYEIGADGVWRPAGRYDVGHYERDDEGTPRLRASAAGGCDFGYAYDETGRVDLEQPNGYVWMTGDNLCSPKAGCYNPATDFFDDVNWVDGFQGTQIDLALDVTPQASLTPVSDGPATPNEGSAYSYMVDSDINVGADGNLIMSGLDANEATMIGDIDVYEPCAPVDYAEVAPPDLSVPLPPPPVHTRELTHRRDASPVHSVNRSWHERNWSWHSRDVSWHYRNRSWHSRDRSWHSRALSWHWRDRSWHSRAVSWHWRDRSWHSRALSWHSRAQSWHDRTRSWHNRTLSWHWRDRSWHSRAISWHWRDRSWHSKALSWHDRALSWHNRTRSWHDRTQSTHDRNRSFHTRSRSWHNKAESWHDRNRSFHSRSQSDAQHHSRVRSNAQHHTRTRSEAQHHSKARSNAQLHSRTKSNAQHHSKTRSDAQRHSRKESAAQNHNRSRSEAQRHSKTRSDAQRHSKTRSDAQRHSKTRSDAQRHSKRESDAQRHSRQRSEAQRHSKRQSDAQRHSKTRSDAQRHSKRESDAARHSKSRSDAQRHSKRESDAARHSKSRTDAQRHNKRQSDAQRHNKRKSDQQRHNRRRTNAERNR
jgi:hypothetical protein